MHTATTKAIDFSGLVRNGQYEEAKQLFFDDAAWTITSPMVNVAQRLFDEARRDRREALFGARQVEPGDSVDGDVVPMTISREQAMLRRVQRAVSNIRHTGNTNQYNGK